MILWKYVKLNDDGWDIHEASRHQSILLPSNEAPAHSVSARLLAQSGSRRTLAMHFCDNVTSVVSNFSVNCLERDKHNH